MQARIKAVLRRIRDRLSALHDDRSNTNTMQARIKTVLRRIQDRLLTAAFNSWVAYWREARKATLADVQYFGGLLDRSWLAWQQVGVGVGGYLQLAGVEAGGCGCWRLPAAGWLEEGMCI